MSNTIIKNATITGDLSAGNGSSLSVSGSTVTGDLNAGDGSLFNVSGSTVTGSVDVKDNSAGKITASSTVTGDINLNTNSSLRLDSSTVIGDLDVRVNSTVTSLDSTQSGGKVLAQAGSNILFEGSSTVAPVSTFWAGTGSLFAFAGTAAITYSGDLDLSHNSILRASDTADLGSASGTTINCQSQADQVDIWTGGSNNVTGVAYNSCP